VEEGNEHYADQGFPGAGPEPGEALASAPSWPPQEQAPDQPAATATADGAPPSDDAGSPAFMPRRPRKLSDAGLSRAFLTDLALKTIHYAGTSSLTHLAERMALSSGIVKELISAIVDERLCEVVSSSSVMPGSYRYRLTPTGLERVKDALERSRYAGPAPVTVEQYIEVAEQQRLARTQPSRRSIEAAVSELVLSPEVADSLARALHSGRCTLIYGPSGNGKTSALEAFARHLEGTALVPYAIYAQGQTIRVFDSSTHIPVQETREPSPVSANDDESRESAPRDRRWALVRRPAIILGGELSKESLELAFDPVSRFHQAPPHVKAQGGVLVVDDFGRQRMSAEDLLNRWLGPLERGWDTLSFQTGEKLSLPIDVHLLFATNLKVELLLDQPSLRRIRYKVEIPNPRREDFREILARACEEHGIEPSDEALDHVVERMYQDGAHMPRASYARDLLDIMVESARYDETEPVLTPEAFESAYRLFIPSPQHKASKPAP
jgi:predicted ATPase with chaperone activity